MNVTYFLGAGASCHAIPTYSDKANFIKELESYMSDISRINIPDNKNKFLDMEKARQQLISNTKWLIDKLDNYNTIDDYAKYLWDSSDPGDRQLYDKLKITLSFYLSIRQLQKRPDLRYTSLIAKINNNTGLNPKFKIITWNYDVQFEKSFFKEKPHLNLDNMHIGIQSYPCSGCSLSFKFDFSRFGKVHLNGIAGFYSAHGRESKPIIQNLYEEIGPLLFAKCLVEYDYLMEHPTALSGLFSYAWEDNDSAKKARDYAVSIAKETDQLVIIGYSFPHFNKDIDREIFKNLVKVEKIVIQDKAPDKIKRVLKDRYGLDSDIATHDVDEFYVPF